MTHDSIQTKKAAQVWRHGATLNQRQKQHVKRVFSYTLFYHKMLERDN